ncbi:MAG: hypothetical protein PHD46_07140 [Eubacteriales bacterium]|nr:hypothetical protein [Eubacteriales bacterium]
MEAFMYSIIAVLCLFLIATSLRLLKQSKVYAEAKKKCTALEQKCKASSHELFRVLSEKNALQAKLDDTLSDIKVLTVTNPERKEGETEAGYARRCRMTIGNKAAQYAKISKQTTTLRICITN